MSIKLLIAPITAEAIDRVKNNDSVSPLAVFLTVLVFALLAYIVWMNIVRKRKANNTYK